MTNYNILRSQPGIYLLYLIFFRMSASAQSPEYTVESFQGNYSELVTYQSIAEITEFDPLWSYEFTLEFPFPFYDSSYNSVVFNRSAWGSFTDNEDESLYLMHYYSWTYDNYLDSSSIFSDARFSNVNINNMQAFVLQFTKARIFADLFEDSLDTYVNFQIWLYENGVIEVHFGEIHMDNNPIYADGKGLYCFTNEEGIDTNEICGPYMGIANPFNDDDAIGMDGAYNNYEIVGDLYSIFTSMPPEGWVIRFKPRTVSISDPKSKYEQLFISPNPTEGYLHFPSSNGRVVVIDATGRIVCEGYPGEDNMDVSFLPSGVYYLHITTGAKISTAKFIRM